MRVGGVFMGGRNKSLHNLDQKNIRVHTPRSQVIDFNCDFGNMTSGALRGSHYRKGYSLDAAWFKRDATRPT